jgi:hypothetical protein
MLKKLIHRFLLHRHFWREVGFDELSEIYVSMMMRSLAISLTGLFVPLYMYRLDYDVTTIIWLGACYFLARGIGGDVAAAYTTARIGPKHTMLIGNLLLICSTAMFLTQQTLNWPIALLGLVWGTSGSFFFVPFHVDFSKIKHKDHGGKEIGWVNIMEKIGHGIGPITGGIIATVFGAQYIFLVAVVLLILGLIPLFSTGEPTRRHQKLDWKGLDARPLARDLVSHAAFGIENTICMFFWPLFLAVFVLAGSTAYAQLGALSSVSVIVSLASVYAIGKLIDNHKGRRLLRVSAIINAAVHVVRPFIRSYPLALVTNVANEAVTAGYRMPYTKGMYDAADDMTGHRIVYITTMEWFSSVMKTVFWMMVWLASPLMSMYWLAVIVFWFAGLGSLLGMTERFKALD